MSSRSVFRLDRTATFALLLAASTSASFGCASDERQASSGAAGTAGTAGMNDPGGIPIEGDGATDFVSDSTNPSSRGNGPEAAGTGGSGGTGSGDPNPPSTDDGGDSPERAISEADIIKLEGATLYALSRYSGLTIIDLANPADLRVIGSFRSTAMPFEMYLENGTAYVMFNDYARREWDEANSSYVWRSSSRMLALDVSSPTNPRVLGYQDLPGEISDSRKVGDIVYVVTHEDSYCWQCDAVPNTRVSSFDVSDPSVFAPIDQERFEDADQSWGPRHVSVSEDRMYVSGFSWSSSGQPESGTIQVVDISDPGGDLAPGAVIEVAGQIDNRWQMDEHDGVLRVISQPNTWNTLPTPVLETFAIAASDTLTPLASLPMVLPRPEALQSVRFDGGRAFAVTFERTDPLFTFDVSDPAAPVQLGELEIPGFLYFMEPRGDRLYSLGFDAAVDGGALHVSIFDVSELAAPVMLDRVNFGGDWAWLAEDQDRVHKVFNLALDRELILLPFSGHEYDEATCEYDWGSGIQLIDARGDELTLRGVAPQIGEARRSLLHGEVLFGISDNAVQAFDISDCDAPAPIDRLDVARNVSAVKSLGDELVRFGHDWWTGQVDLDVVALAQAEAAAGDARLDLTPLTDVQSRECSTGSTYHSRSGYFTGDVFVHGDHALLPRTVSEYVNDGAGYRSDQTMKISVVGLAGDSPAIAAEITLEPTGYDSNDPSRSSSYAEVLQTDSALLVGRRSVTGSGESATTTFEYDVIDLRAGANAEVVQRFTVPDHFTRGGWGYLPYGCMIDMPWGWYGIGYGGTGTLSSGDVIVSQHQEPLDDGSGRTRYYLDRFDLADPAAPVALAPVNIPGQVIHYDHARGLLVTVEDLREVVAEVTHYSVCTQNHPGTGFEVDQDAYVANGYDYERTPGVCVIWHRRLNSLALEGETARRVSQLALTTSTVDGVEHRTGAIAVSDSRIFYQRFATEIETGSSTAELVALGYGANGELTLLGRAPSKSLYYDGTLMARGNRALIPSYGVLEVFHAPNGAVPLRSEHELRGWSCNPGALELVGNQAFCASGEFGVQRIVLD